MKRYLVAALGVVLLAAPAAHARPGTSCGNARLLGAYSGAYNKVADRFGARAPGRNIRRYGLRRGRPASCGRVRASYAVLDRALHPPPPPATYYRPAAEAYSASSSAGGGAYCGLFQFDQGTWRGVGGSGSPCAASPAEQWARARRLQRQRGNAPWPVCGRGGASLEQIVGCESGGNPHAVG